MQQQRVIDNTPIITVPMVPRITNAPPILQSRNPTAKRTLKDTPCVHQRVTQNNTPGGIPKISRPPTRPLALRVSPRKQAAVTQTLAAQAAAPSHRRLRTFAQQAMNVITITTYELATGDTTFTPRAFVLFANTKQATCYEHYANPMVHPITGETISSYKKLMNNPTTAEVWRTAFGKGCNKMGQKGTNVMFVMTKAEIASALAAGKKITYANPVVDHRPQKEDPNRIQITDEGNLIQCKSELSVCIADINTEKLHWNSVVSTDDARYMSLDIKSFYLTAALEYYEYMRIPLSHFPAWTIEQYNLLEHAYNGYLYIEMQQAVWGLPQAGILANKRLRWK